MMEVEAILYFREPVNVLAADPTRKPLATIGYAPESSMFWYGENSERKFDDYRPQVHDSDGLLMHMDNGTMVWRPLVNGAVLGHQTFPANNVRGFGLLQRDRNFSDYQDLFRTYHEAPSVWVAPHGDWGGGQVHLVELSTQYEGLDNIVAFWDPAVKPPPLQPLRFGYTLYWTREADMTLSSNQVVSTRTGVNPRDQAQRQFVIDFNMPGVTAEDAPPKADVTCGDNGTVTEVQTFRNTPEKTWRVFINMLPKPGGHDPVDLKCTLRKGAVQSETWAYRWSPP
jgi:glucans biosynthesis protein